METLGWPEILVIAVVFVVLFGGKKIPEIGKGIGEGIRNFKAAMKSESEAAKDEKKAEDEKVST